MRTDAIREGFAIRMAEILADLGIQSGHGEQAALGRLFGKTPKAARKWLTGESLPELDLAIEIATKAGVNVNWLLQGAGPKRSDRIETKALVLNEALQDLPTEERREALNYIRFKLEQARATFTKERFERYNKALDEFSPPATGQRPPPKRN